MSARDVILHNFWLKLLSLGLASLIYVGVRYQIHDYSLAERSASPVFKQTFKVRVSTITPGDGRGFRIQPREAQVTVWGGQAALRKLSPSNLVAYIDLTDFSSKTPVPVELRVHTPADVYVGDIQPPDVTVEQLFQKPPLFPADRKPQ